SIFLLFFFQAEDGIRDLTVTGVQTCALPISAVAATHTAAECRAACEARNIPASCGWMSRAPQRCARDAQRACETSHVPGVAQCRSEERRVGKECRSRWTPCS